MVQAFIDQNSDTPPGMLSYDCHSTQLLIDDVLLGFVPDAVFADTHFFGKLRFETPCDGKLPFWYDGGGLELFRSRSKLLDRILGVAFLRRVHIRLH